MPFISFEGVDGSGKTTQVRWLADWLAARNIRVLRTKEPDGGHLGLRMRAVLTDPDLAGRLAPIEELLLVSAARYDHVKSVIRPALERGEWVLCDRFYDSTFAIQIFETGLDREIFDVVTRAVAGHMTPDLTVVLDLDDVAAKQRRGGRSGSVGTDDPSEAFRNFNRIRRGLAALAAEQPTRCRIVDSSGSEEEVANSIRRLICDLERSRNLT